MKNNSKVKYLVGDKKLNLKSTLPYNDLLCNFLDYLSKELDSHYLIKKYPDIKTLAFWCRRGNILRFRKNFMSKEVRLGLGLIFHITPSNIPTNFAYSLIFGLITGNSNIIKVPSKRNQNR